MSQRPHLFGLTPEALVEACADRGHSLELQEARRALAHVLSHSRAGWPERFAHRHARFIEANFDRQPLTIEERVTDASDGFVKYLFRHRDGAVTEAVRIPLHKPMSFSLCLSTQVGCAMGCDFCATGRLGWTRHLETWEMVSAFIAVRDECPGRVTGAVFQGQGEPLHNYDEVIRAAQVLSAPCGGRISAEAITISTVGLVPALRRYTAEGHPYRLIVSLTSAVPERRARLLPIAGKQGIDDVIDAIRAHAASRKGRTTVAWVLLGGLNHDAQEVEALRTQLEGVPLRLNLIDVNDARDGGYRQATDEERRAFINELQVLQAPIVRRYSGGAARHAACGMLAATRWDGGDSGAPDKAGPPAL